MTLPDRMRDALKEKLWAIADRIDWLALGQREKAQHYENWTKDPNVGGVLGRYMDLGQVRVYIKDSLLKAYPRARRSDQSKPFRMLGIEPDVTIVHEFIKPHGRRLADGRLICWGRAHDWKTILMAAHERSFESKGTKPFAVVLTQSAGQYGDVSARAVVIDAAKKLGIEKLVWDS